MFSDICTNFECLLLPSEKSSKAARLNKLSAVQMLKKKFERKAELKKELEIKKLELELQASKMDQEETARKQEQVEKNKQLELELEERRTMLELLKKHL